MKNPFVQLFRILNMPRARGESFQEESSPAYFAASHQEAPKAEFGVTNFKTN